MQSRKLYIISIIVFCILIAIISGRAIVSDLKGNPDKKSIQLALVKVAHTPTLSPTPFPFQDITIPYLRSRDYNSRLKELTKSYENGNYTAYLTGYDSDGLNINGLLTIPKEPSLPNPPAGGKSRWPAIVFIHGYIPPKQYKTQINYASYVDYLARNGFVVFKIDLRGHDTSEGEPGGAYFSSDYIIDTLNAYAALQSADFVNPKAIGLWGHSMAGNVVARSIAAKTDIPAAVIWAGAVYTYDDQRAFGINDASYIPPPSDTQRVRRRQQIRDLYGDPSSESVFWQQVAVTKYLKDLKGTLQINHAVNDPVVSIKYSRNLMKLLDETSVGHELIEYPNGGHNLTGASFTQAMQNTVAFFHKNLKD